MLTTTQRHNLKEAVQYAMRIGYTTPAVPTTPSHAELRTAAHRLYIEHFGTLGYTLMTAAAQLPHSADLCYYFYNAYSPARSWSAKDVARALTLALILRAYTNQPADYRMHTPAAREARASFTELCKLIALRRRSAAPWRDQTPLLRALYRAACHLSRTAWVFPKALGRVRTLDDATSVRDEACLALRRYHDTLVAIAHRNPFTSAVPLLRYAQDTCMWLSVTAAEPLPWADAPWYLSSETACMVLAHPASSSPGQVAYLRDYEKLVRGSEPVFTTTSPGKFLSRLRTTLQEEEQASGAGYLMPAGIGRRPPIAEELTDEAIKGYVNEMIVRSGAAKFELRILDNDDPKWATAPRDLQDEWKRLYEQIEVDGSCMRGSDGVRAYGLPGNHLGLAYLYHPESRTKFCRAILHRHHDCPAGVLQSDAEYIDPLTKTWCVHRGFGSTDGDGGRPRISEEQIETLLARNGWEKERDLGGALLASLDTSGRADDDCADVLMPYIDGDSQYVEVAYTDGRRVFRVCDGGDVSATDTSGWVSVFGSRCACCGEGMHEEDLTYVEDDGDVCDSCLRAHYTRYETRYGYEWVRDLNVSDVAVYDESGERWVAERDVEYFNLDMCVVRDEWYDVDDLCATADGLVHEDEAIELSLPCPEGFDYGHPAHVEYTTRLDRYGYEERVAYHEDTPQDELDAFLAEYDEHYVRKETWGQYVSYFTCDDEVQVTLPEDPTIYW